MVKYTFNTGLEKRPVPNPNIGNQRITLHFLSILLDSFIFGIFSSFQSDMHVLTATTLGMLNVILLNSSKASWSNLMLSLEDGPPIFHSCFHIVLIARYIFARIIFPACLKALSFSLSPVFSI